MKFRTKDSLKARVPRVSKGLAVVLFAVVAVEIANEGYFLRLHNVDIIVQRKAEAATSVTTDVSHLNRACLQNPYLGALNESLTTIGTRMDSWLGRMEDHYAKTTDISVQKYGHARFFPFDPKFTSTCKEQACVGGRCRDDTSKIVCGLDRLQQQEQSSRKNGDADKNCIVYSIGGNNLWEFENALLKQTPCDVHTFDCTGLESRFQKPQNDRLHFHHVCLGHKHEDADPDCGGTADGKCGETWTLLEMQQRLDHKRIDLLKIDIEGFEWPLFESWPELTDQGSDELVLPMQILAELHYQTQFEILRPEGVSVSNDFKVGRDMVNLQAHLLRMGYISVIRDDNQSCGHCTELTLIRARCPGQ